VRALLHLRWNPALLGRFHRSCPPYPDSREGGVDGLIQVLTPGDLATGVHFIFFTTTVGMFAPLIGVPLVVWSFVKLRRLGIETEARARP